MIDLFNLFSDSHLLRKKSVRYNSVIEMINI